MVPVRPLKLCVQLTALLFVLCASSNAQEPQIQFERIEGADSFSNAGIFGIAQDIQGFMWFGSLGDGLARYDGYEFKVFRHDENDARSLSSNDVHRITIAPDGTMWVATAEGLNEYDAQTETFTRYVHDPGNAETISSSYVSRSLVDSDGTLWVGTANGLNRRNPGETGFHHYPLMRETTDSDEFDGIAPTRVEAMLLDRAGTLWLGTLGGGLLRYDRDTDSFTRFMHDPDDPNSLTDNTIREIYEDREKTLWLATIRGISRMDRANNTFRNYVPDDDDPTSLRGNFTNGLLEDSLGNFWVAADMHGLSLFNRTSETFSHYYNEPANPQSLGPGRLWSIYEDRGGVIWLGTNSINRIVPTVHAFQLYRNTTQSVREGVQAPDGMIQTKDGRLWLNTHEGVDRFDPATAEWERFALHPEDPGSGYNEATAIHEDRAGNLWVTHPRSLCRVDMETGLHKSIDYKRKPIAVYVDTAGRLWLSMPFYGFAAYNFSTGEQEHLFVDDPDNPESISHTFGYFANEDSAGRFWVGTYSGLNLFDFATESFERYFPAADDENSISSKDVRAYFEDSAGNIWFGTAYGLNRYIPETDSFMRYFNGPGTSSNRILSIVAGDDNRLWLHHGGGLAEFDPATGSFRNISHQDGLPRDFGWLIVRDKQNGFIYMATTEGVVSFDPAKFDLDSDSPSVALTDFRLFNKSVPIQTAEVTSPLQSAIGSTNHLTLGHEDTLLSFSFSALDYANPAENQYAYRLEGFDSAWIETDSTLRVATYTALPAGNYVFWVKAANSHGVWNEQGAALGLTILPPWWETIWAYVSYAVIALGLLGLLIRFRTRTLRIRSGELEKLVDERTDELRTQKEIVQEQASYLEELMVAKDRYFTNVSHEFRTPLTVILGPIERLLAQISDIDARRYLQTVRRNASRLLRLVDQLLGLSRIESGQTEPSAPHSVKSTISYITASLESIAKDKQITLASETVEDVWVQSSGNALEEIVINLLSNAIKYTPPCGKVSVSAMRDEDAICIDVADTGPGIPSDQQEHVFERFYRVDDLAELAPGSGLGLALVKELARSNGGEISLDSTEGVGTTIQVRLPAADAPSDSPEMRAPAASVSTIVETSVASLANSRPTGQKAGDDDARPNMLVIEDNLDLCRHLEDVFGSTLRCSFAHDGQAGLDTAIDDIPDVILCDAMLPKINGFEVTRRLKEDDRTSHIPVIMLTALVDEESRLSGLKALADDYVAKPFNEAELRQRVFTILAVREILRQRYSREVHQMDTSKFRATMSERDRRFVGRVDDALAQHYADPEFSTSRFASQVAMSDRQLQRKLKALMNYTPREYLRNYRLTQGAKMLHAGSSVGDAAYSVGFLSLSYFAKCFKAQFGVSPSDVLDDSNADQSMSGDVG